MSDANLMRQAQCILEDLLDNLDHSSSGELSKSIQSVQLILQHLCEQPALTTSSGSYRHHLTNHAVNSIKQHASDNDYSSNTNNDSYMSDEEDDAVCAGNSESTTTATNVKTPKQKLIRRCGPSHSSKRVFSAVQSNAIANGNTTSANLLEAAIKQQRSVSLKSSGHSINENFMQHLNNLYNKSCSGNGSAGSSSNASYLCSTSTLRAKQGSGEFNSSKARIDNEAATKSDSGAEAVGSDMDSGAARANCDEDDEDSSVMNNSSSNGSMLAKNKTSDYESGESPTNSDYNSDTEKLHLKVI